MDVLDNRTPAHKLIDRSSYCGEFEDFVDEVGYDFPDFGTDKLYEEQCPDCGDEILVRQDGKTDCECGHKEVLPCAQCPLHEVQLCDWNEDTRCTAFPKN